jgi:hypothetical protein
MGERTIAAPATPPTSPATPPARAADLDALRAYARTLADRMGLKDWTFEVRDIRPDGDEDSIEVDWLRGRRHAVICVAPDSDYFDRSPEDRRFALVREFVILHILGPDDGTTTGSGQAVAAVAAAWAPALPLPLVGLMRPLRGAGKEIAAAREDTR